MITIMPKANIRYLEHTQKEEHDSFPIALKQCHVKQGENLKILKAIFSFISA